LYQFVMAKNNRATYYVFDAFDPKAFRNKEEYTHFVYQQYKQWQEKYLE